MTALRGVSFDVEPGTCHAVCGENGAGKSSLGKILAGIQRPDEGTLALDGEEVQFANPSDALAAGVAMVHQELAFCENMSVGENLCLGRLPRRRGFLDRPALRARARQLLAAVGASIDPDRPMQELGTAEQQVVQIAAAVGANARVIVFDEPTSSLGESETAALYELMLALKARGVTMLFVSHRMDEIFRLCDRVTVLRDGAHVVTQVASALDEGALVELMIGRRLEQYFPAHAVAARGAERLRVENLGSPGRFQGVSFTLHAGEVLGLAGLVGAGRSEVAHAIFGLDAAAHGTISVGGRAVAIRSPRDAMRLGIGFVPEDRKRQGLVLSMVARENATLPTLDDYAHLGLVDAGREAAAADQYFDRLRVRATGDTATVSLSGGNQQKVVLAKWLAARSDILILDEPTRGVDVGAKTELHAWIDRLAADGAAVLLISSELPELLNLSTRILVLRDGCVVGEVDRANASQELLLRMMAGLGLPGQRT